MLKVLLVDDEPFILQGLKALMDWERFGYEIAGMASDGKEAFDYLKENKADLIIADIKMPVMSGIELLREIREKNISDAYFVILSGFADFNYAKSAIRYKCTDYLLKPVDKEELARLLEKVAEMKSSSDRKAMINEKMEHAYLAGNVISVITGKFDSLNLEYVKSHMRLSHNVRYIDIEIDDSEAFDEITDEEKRACQRKIFAACLEYAGNDSGHCVFDVSGHEKIYDVGLVYCDYMSGGTGSGTGTDSTGGQGYIRGLLEHIKRNVQLPVVVLAGKEVSGIENIDKSYSSACMLRSLRGFRTRKEIYYYENEVQVSESNAVLCKDSLDRLLNAVEQNNHADIHACADKLYEEMQQMELSGKGMSLNINYMLFQLIHLATEQDDGVNQDEILRLMSDSAVEEGIKRGSKAHLLHFACEYGDYLMQLRKSASRGILSEVEKEVHGHYAENLTLKDLSKKYYINSAYLGQLFRKKYGQSFKDYLNSYRMEQAAQMLLRTDEKIYMIAEKVGYHDLDYFVNRFIEAKGCTPTKFRKEAKQ